ncbi:MAG: YkgJ family cysteine cluster protein [Chitinispirillia bacterium]|nr:YkgJ family cysteine cluster protein [Chitinispirillia bacterium]MCL2268991.1 YkgJ family cysteine cluster protein [Chitinispirillia bacterium]
MTNRCKKCDAYCCRHVAIVIDIPMFLDDYDNIRWYLLHKNVWVSIGHDDTWTVEFKTPCRHIAGDFKCSIYPKRPRICKDYPGKGELCEGETSEPSYKKIFKNAKEFEKYLHDENIT